MPPASTLRIVPLTLDQANQLVTQLHRHHPAARGCRFCIGVIDQAGTLRGAAIIGRPVSRHIDQHAVAEVTRLVTDGCPNACSALYGAAARAAKVIGYQRIQTYILADEPGTTLRAAGWTLDAFVPGGKWSYGRRGGNDRHPTGPKQRWGKDLNPPAPAPIEARP